MPQKYPKDVLRGFCCTKAAILSDLHHTTMKFTAGNNEPVICCCIKTSKSKKGIPTCCSTILDFTKIVVYTYDETEIVGNKIGQLLEVALCVNLNEWIYLASPNTLYMLGLMQQS